MNKLVVITGGSKGIGRALVRKFAAGGCDVITCSRNPGAFASEARELSAAHDVRVEVQAADLSTQAGANAFAAYCLAQRPAIDVLINNAGYFLPGTLLGEEEGNLESLLNANLMSAYWLTRNLQSALKTSKGHVFNMCSIASKVAYPSGGSYSVAKFALLGFSKSLREELKPHGVRVTAILPGATLTDSWAGVDLPAERFMPAEDVADLIWSAWQLSPRSVVEEIVVRPQLGDI